MKKRGLLSGLVLASICAVVGGIGMPVSASANTVSATQAVTLHFDPAGPSITSSDIASVGLDFVSTFGSGDVFTAALYGSGGTLLGSHDYSYATDPTTSFKIGVSGVPAYLVASGKQGSFDLTSVAYTAYDSKGISLGTVADAPAAPTPIPASLPLFLTGAIIVYGLARRGRARAPGFRAA